MEVWIPLISVVIGGFIAVVPVLITLKNQSVEREKDRDEKWIEAGIQLTLELVKKDIEIIEGVVDD